MFTDTLIFAKTNGIRQLTFCNRKWSLAGPTCNGRIYFTGRPYAQLLRICQCEVYSEKTNEWQIIASLNIRQGIRANLLLVDDQPYALASGYYNRYSHYTRVECYDADNDKWIWKTEISILMPSNTRSVVKAYPARIFKGFFSNIVNWKATISEHFLPLPGQRKRMHVMKRPSITFLHSNLICSNVVRICNLYTTRTYFVYLFCTWPISSQIVHQTKSCKSVKR